MSESEMTTDDFDGTRGSEKTILFVEDEPLVRTHMAECLRECGYRVHEAADAREAMAALRSNFPVDLVLTDVALPRGMSGIELARWIGRNRPSINVLVASGACPEAARECPEARFLPKPYSHRELLGQVRLALADG
jgi:CheY-like chemotaxis protein